MHMLRVPKVQEPRLRHCQASKESRFRQELPPRHRHTAIDIDDESGSGVGGVSRIARSNNKLQDWERKLTVGATSRLVPSTEALLSLLGAALGNDEGQQATHSAS